MSHHAKPVLAAICMSDIRALCGRARMWKHLRYGSRTLLEHIIFVLSTEINIYILSKNVAYLILYNLNKPEPIIKIFSIQYPDNPSF